jgi:hypothetical protein
MMQSKAISFEGAILDGCPKRDSEYTWLNQNNDDAKAKGGSGYTGSPFLFSLPAKPSCQVVPIGEPPYFV